jgi:hypothetical protein
LRISGSRRSAFCLRQQGIADIFLMIFALCAKIIKEMYGMRHTNYSTTFDFCAARRKPEYKAKKYY